MNSTKIHAQLKGKSYTQLACEMENFSTDTLVELLNSSSTRIGDTASSILQQRNKLQEIAIATLNGIYTRKYGKIRAANTLCHQSSPTDLCEEALLSLIRDSNEEIAGNALFNLIVLGRKSSAGKLQKLKPKVSSSFLPFIDLAIQALKQGDPSIYSPNFRHRRN